MTLSPPPLALHPTEPAPTSSRFASPRIFWVTRELNLITLFRELKVTTLSGSGCWVIRKVRPSAQGGVVREPVYWNRGVVCTCSIRAAKSRAPVSVIVPGVEISESFSVTLVMSSVVLPFSLSWNRTARTAMLPDPSIGRLLLISQMSWAWKTWTVGERCRYIPEASWTICISKGKYSSAILCSEGVWKWSCLREKSFSPSVVVPLTITSTVVPKFSNSALCTLSIFTTGAFLAKPMVSSMLIGDCTFDEAQALLAVSRPAQLKGPCRPVYPKVLTAILPPGSSVRGKSDVAWRQLAKA